MNKLPIGIQNFESLRNDGYLYVDKTDYIYRLVHYGKPYFLSRPRRFGKSLLLSTIRAYWEGKKELFSGLSIENLEENNPDAWQPHPIFYFDFNGQNYLDTPLETILDGMLTDWESVYGDQFRERTIGERFEQLLKSAHAQTGKRCVILVDEYDKPLLETIDAPELEEHNKAVFKGFFSTLKKADEYIRFVFVTGVTKFNKISIFSDLNQLNDISLNADFSGICGITEDELLRYFQENIAALASENDMSPDACLAELKRTYDGYRFHPKSQGIFNPFSLLKAFFENNFGSYWFETGTPTFLVRGLKKSEYDIRKFTDGTLYANDAMLSDYRADSPDLTPLLFQTGYLTIIGFDRETREYTLAFPNEEVKYGFLENLLPAYVEDYTAGSGKDIFTLRRYIERGSLDDIKNVLTALFASIPYTTADSPFEHYFQTVLYLVFTLLGRYTHCEMHTYKGRIDCIVEARQFVYLFEFKRDKSAESALRQIDKMGYALAYAADQRTLYKIGVSFDSSSRALSEWLVDDK